MNSKKRVAIIAAVAIGVLTTGSAVALAAVNGRADEVVSGSPSETSTPSASPQPASSPSPSPSSIPSDDPVASDPWVIGMAQVGPLTAGMSPDQIAVETGVTDTEPWFADQANSGCSIFTVGAAGSAAATTAVAVSQGGRGPVDFFTISGEAGSGQGTPSTAEGLTIGATESAIASVYGDQLVEVPFAYAERRLVVHDGDYAIVFDIDDGVVSTISTGSFAQIDGFSECA